MPPWRMVPTSSVGPAAPRIASQLGTTQWGVPGSSAPHETLDLRYAPDESALLDPTPAAMLAPVFDSAQGRVAELMSHYAVEDPYGAIRGVDVVSRYFECPIETTQLSFGAGVTSLLHDLSSLAGGGMIVAPALVHTDLEIWAATRGSSIRLLADPCPFELLERALRSLRPAVLHLDRPSFTGDVLSLPMLTSLVNTASQVGTIVVVDESPATYLGPKGSSAPLVTRLDNLVVLRGFTKGYSLGGLRSAFVLASHNVAGAVRELLTPMQVSELSLTCAWRVLDAGDVFSRLVARVRRQKPVVSALLTSAGLEVIPGYGALPWIAVRDGDGIVSRKMERHRIRPLMPTSAVTFPEAFRENATLRVTIPLSDERMRRLKAHLAQTNRESEEEDEFHSRTHDYGPPG